jgi:hypothetical protein
MLTYWLIWKCDYYLQKMSEYHGKNITILAGSEISARAQLILKEEYNNS